MNNRHNTPAWLLLSGAALLLYGAKRLFPGFLRPLLVLGGIGLAGILLLTAVVVYFAFRKPKTEQNDTKQMLGQGRTALLDLRRRIDKVADPEVRRSSMAVHGSMEKIMGVLRDKPEQIGRARQFLRYYLPTTGEILRKYVELEGAKTADADVRDDLLACLADIETAMEKQYASLFEEVQLDLTVEMEVLTRICRRDGLLDDGFRTDADDAAAGQTMTKEE